MGWVQCCGSSGLGSLGGTDALNFCGTGLAAYATADTMFFTFLSVVFVCAVHRW